MAGPALAVDACGDRADFIAHLGAQFAETPTARGIAADGNVVEVLTSPGGTWTIIVTNPAGVTCAIGAGESWQPVDRTPIKKTGFPA